MQLLRRYRFLLIIYVPAAALAYFEARRHVQPAPPAQLADVLAQLDPESKNANYFKGLLAIQEQRPREARKYFERALALSDNDENDERLVYYYSLVLIGLNEDSVRIDDAVDRWRRRFPHSTRPDPRRIDPRRIQYELRAGLNAAAANQRRTKPDGSPY